MEKYLIINADDYGYNEEQSDAIIELLNKKLITSSSFLCVTGYSEQASVRAKVDNISFGVHLCINSDSATEPWHSVSGSPSLSDNRGLYSEQHKITFNAKRKEVAAELQAQYDFLISRGVTVDHADNHCATLYGINGRRFYNEAFEFCRKNKLPYRFPKSSGFIKRQLGLKKVPKIVDAFQTHIVKLGEKQGVRMPDDVVSNPWSAKDIKDCDILKKYYIEQIKNCISGVTEIFLHPAEERADVTGEWKKRVYEYEILKSGDLLQAAEDVGAKLISWSDFAKLNMEDF